MLVLNCVNTQLKILKSESDKVWLRNRGTNTIFFGSCKTDPRGKIEGGCVGRIFKNDVYWSAVGQVDVEIIENEKDVSNIP